MQLCIVFVSKSTWQITFLLKCVTVVVLLVPYRMLRLSLEHISVVIQYNMCVSVYYSITSRDSGPFTLVRYLHGKRMGPDLLFCDNCDCIKCQI